MPGLHGTLPCCTVRHSPPSTAFWPLQQSSRAHAPTNGTSASTAAHRSGRSLAITPISRPPAEPPCAATRFLAVHPEPTRWSAQAMKSVNVLRLVSSLPSSSYLQAGEGRAKQPRERASRRPCEKQASSVSVCCVCVWVADAGVRSTRGQVRTGTSRGTQRRRRTHASAGTGRTSPHATPSGCNRGQARSQARTRHAPVAPHLAAAADVGDRVDDAPVAQAEGVCGEVGIHRVAVCREGRVGVAQPRVGRYWERGERALDGKNSCHRHQPGKHGRGGARKGTRGCEGARK